MNMVQVELALGHQAKWKDAYARPDRNRDLVSAPPGVIPPVEQGCLQNVIVDLRAVPPEQVAESASRIVYRVAGVEVSAAAIRSCPEVLQALAVDPAWTWVDVADGGESVLDLLARGWSALPRRIGLSVRTSSLESIRIWSRIGRSSGTPLRFVWVPGDSRWDTVRLLSWLGRFAHMSPPTVLGVDPDGCGDGETDRLFGVVCSGLRELGLRRMGVHLVSCPACARTQVNLRAIATRVWEAIAEFDADLCVAVMGCEVNGPGEARMADLGVACGKGMGLIFREGKVVRRVPETEIAAAMVEEVRRILSDRSPGKETVRT